MPFNISIVAQSDAATMKLLNGMVASISNIQSTLAAMQTTENKNMSALSDAVAAIQTTLSTLSTDMNKAFTDLEAAVTAADGVSPDVTAAVTALGAINTSLQGLDASAIAADATTTPPSPPAA